MESEAFRATGIYRLSAVVPGADGDVKVGAVFLDPVRLLADSYRRYTPSRAAYYSRRFGQVSSEVHEKAGGEGKRKRERRRKPRELNEKEKAAEARHQEVRRLLAAVHEALLKEKELLRLLPEIVGGQGMTDSPNESDLKDFVEIGSSWRAPFCEISLRFPSTENHKCLGGSGRQVHNERTVMLFNNLVNPDCDYDVEVEFHNRRYIVPGKSCFFMSDFRNVRELIPDDPTKGYNLIVIDPPWENGSVRQKTVYWTLPNRNLLYLPIKELAHADGALVVLWVTNREKFRLFVENELFCFWGLKNVTQFYWLKVKHDGTLISDLDLFHHRPYECCYLGYYNTENVAAGKTDIQKVLEDISVIMSIPSVHSRKPPLGKLLQAYIPGPKPTRCIELFARELAGGWTSWGNEPLRFQDSLYFLDGNR